VDAFELILEHRYSEALRICKASIKARRGVANAIANRAVALLNLGRLSEALVDFEWLSEDARQLTSNSSPRLHQLGVVHWLIGHRTTAKELFRAEVDGVRHGTIGYADAAGGVSQGLLLWYAGVASGDRNASEHAIGYLDWLAKKKRTLLTQIGNWPGPLARFAIGDMNPKTLLRQAFESETLNGAVERARGDVLLTRHLQQALVAIATSHRVKGEEQKCRAAMIKCAELGNTHAQEEWYIAAAEVGSFPLSQSHSTRKKQTRRQSRVR
jgi:hypothetical protein